MASVAPPEPAYRPHLPANLVSEGLLSDAQLESVIYAGEAHGGYLAGSWTVDDTFDVVSAAADDAEKAVRFRRGWFLGDGTGAGKGRQVAGILLDNWLKGRRRAVWISKSDKLIEDAQRDWSALGQERLLITPLSRFRQGTPIRLDEGILFTTYATLRSDAREERVLRAVKQRLHQASFREAVIAAYNGRCALSGLREPLLLDAAHIVADKEEQLGQPIVSNGLPLSKIHHAGFDAHLIGIDPDYRLHVSGRLLALNDGPLLEALKRLNGEPIHLPARLKDRPDRDRLALRFERFNAVA